MFDRLDFVYLPSRNVAADLEQSPSRLSAHAWRWCGWPRILPPLLLAGHLQGDQPVLVYRVEDLDQGVAELRDRQVELGSGFEIPHGRGVEVTNPGPQRVALYERTRPEADERLAGRRDF